LPSNWRAGLSEVAKQGAFVTPPVGGWVFVVGRDVAARTADPAQVEALIGSLSEVFGEAFWFIADTGRDVFGWARGAEGRCTRAYAFAEELGHYLWLGEVTDQEHELGCFIDDPRDRSEDAIKWWPDLSVVCAVAARWAVDPSRLGGHANSEGVGLLGRL